MPRIQGLTELPFSNADSLVKTGKGYIFSITLTFRNATIGDQVVLRNGLDAAAPFLVPFVFATANGTITKTWENGKEFTTGLFIDIQGAGIIQGEMTYK